MNDNGDYLTVIICMEVLFDEIIDEGEENIKLNYSLNIQDKLKGAKNWGAK